MPMRRQNVAAALKYLQDKADLRGRFERATSLDPQEQDMADIAVETAAGFIPGVGQALAARDVERARRADDPAGMAMASIGAIPGGRLAGLLKRYDPVMQQLDVYHGTPHKFPATEANPLGEFDGSKIGTGEGAQAYGHGIYLAENPEIARDYQVRLSYDPEKMKIGGKQINAVYNQLQDTAARMPPARAAAEYEKMDLIERLMMNNPVDEVEKAAAELSPATQKWFATQVKPSFETYGSFYKADLPDEMVDRMLDWDKPLSEQPALLKAAQKLKNDYLSWDEPVETATGRDLYEALEAQIGNKEATAVMKGLNIPGIRYLDAGSRGQGGSGTRNFVVFPGEEKKVKILKRE